MPRGDSDGGRPAELPPATRIEAICPASSGGGSVSREGRFVCFSQPAKQAPAYGTKQRRLVVSSCRAKNRLSHESTSGGRVGPQDGPKNNERRTHVW